MSFRIEQANAPGVTGAFVFSPVPALPNRIRVVVERSARENSSLGPNGWTESSRGLKPRHVERRGAELWLMFGPEVSYYVLPHTPVTVRLAGTEIWDQALWPHIPRGPQPDPVPDEDDGDDTPVMDVVDDDATVYIPPPGPAEPAVVETPAPEETETVIQAPKPEKVRIPEELPAVPEGPVPDDELARLSGWPARLVMLLIVVLIAAGAGLWWWQPPEPVIVNPQPQPQPRPQPQPQPQPGPDPRPADPCIDPAAVMAGRCPADRLAALDPAAQTALAQALLRRGDSAANNRALPLLNAASAGGQYGPAYMALARLYDPASFAAGGPVSAASPARALDLYKQARDAGVAEAEPARAALIQRLRDAARQQGADGARARDTLSSAGIPLQ